MLLAYTHLSNDQVDAADKILTDIMQFAGTYGYEYLGTSAQALAGMVTLARGNLGAGFKTIHDRMETFRTKGKRYHWVTFQYLLGKVHFEMALQRRPMRVGLILKNLPFLIRHAPFAYRKAEKIYKAALSTAESIGAMDIAGQMYFDLAQLYVAKSKRDLAKEVSHRSMAIFRACDADVYLEQASTFATEHELLR